MKKKSQTLSEHEKAVNKVVDYINSHLYEAPGIKILSEVANISGFHFHRIFKAIIGENIGEFVSRLRLEDVALRLLMSKDTLSDIAFDTGFGTKSALSRAFKMHFGILPSVYRRQSKNLHPFFGDAKYPCNNLVPDIRMIPPKDIVYVRIIDVYGAEESYRNAWAQLGEFAREKNLLNDSIEFIGLSFDDPAITHPLKCRFYASFTVTQPIKPEGAFGSQRIPGGKYAVFLHKGAYYKLKDTYYNIYVNWLPKSDMEIKGSMSFEVYLNSPSNTQEDKLLTEIYLPVK